MVGILMVALMNLPTDGNPVAKLTINGGTFTGGLNTVKNDDAGEMIINGGTITGFAQSCVQNNNVLTITGGDIVEKRIILMQLLFQERLLVAQLIKE